MHEWNEWNTADECTSLMHLQDLSLLGCLASSSEGCTLARAAGDFKNALRAAASRVDLDHAALDDLALEYGLYR